MVSVRKTRGIPLEDPLVSLFLAPRVDIRFGQEDLHLCILRVQGSGHRILMRPAEEVDRRVLHPFVVAMALSHSAQVGCSHKRVRSHGFCQAFMWSRFGMLQCCGCHCGQEMTKCLLHKSCLSVCLSRNPPLPSKNFRCQHALSVGFSKVAHPLFKIEITQFGADRTAGWICVLHGDRHLSHLQMASLVCDHRKIVLEAVREVAPLSLIILAVLPCCRNGSKLATR